MTTIRKLLTGTMATLALSTTLPAFSATPGQGYDVFGTHAAGIGVGESLPAMAAMAPMGTTMVGQAGQGWDVFRTQSGNIGVGQALAEPIPAKMAMAEVPSRGFDLFRAGDSTSL